MRITKTLMKIAMVIGLVAITVFALGLPALAQVNGPTPPALGDPASGDVSPHGGYSSGTDFCLQCHTVHTAPDPGYALMARASTTAVCATCHGYLGAGATGAIDPDVDADADPTTGGIHGTASQRAVYTSVPVHGIGLTGGPPKYASNWNYGWGFTGPQGPSTTNVNTVKGTASAVAGGLYCMNCHTPHGEFGQLINSKWVYTTAGEVDPDGAGPLSAPAAVKAWADGTPIWWDDPDATPEDYEVRYLHNAGTYWEVCPDTSYTGCAPAQVFDAEGQLVSLYGYKLLSSSPNHQYPFPTGGAAPPGGLYSNAGAMIGDLVGAMGVADLTFTVNETTGTLTTSPGTSGYVKIGTETIRFTARANGGTCTGTGSTFPCTAAVYTVAPADPAADGKTGRGWNNTVAAAHAAGDDVLTFGSVRASVRSWDTDIYNHDGSLFCGTCHSSRIDWSWGGTNHNHPTGCEACHGNPSDGSSSDYPHSSTQPALLQDVPDGLCINCHTAGSLP